MVLLVNCDGISSASSYNKSFRIVVNDQKLPQTTRCDDTMNGGR